MDNKKTENPNSRKVTIFRAGSFLSRAQGKEIEDHYASAKVSVGSYFESKNSLKIGSGLSFLEEELLLPPLIDTPVGDKEFRKKITEFFQEIDTKVPETGIELEIGLEVDSDKPISDKNMPINLSDYVRYRHARNHPFMAKNKAEADSDATKQYYIFDKGEIQNKNKKAAEERDSAMQIFLQVKEKVETVDMMLTLMGKDVRAYKDLDLKVAELRSLAEKKAPEFNETYKAGKLDIRSWIQNMLRTKVIKQMGVKYVTGEEGKLLANNFEELVTYFEDTDNADSVVALKARLQEEMLKAPEGDGIRKTQLLPGGKVPMV